MTNTIGSNSPTPAVFDNLSIASKQSQEAESKQTLDQSAFLQLLTTQLNNQDPLSPVSNEAFVAQMAQFSSVEGITKLNSTVDSMNNLLKSNRALDATVLVGKSVMIPADKAWLNEGAHIKGVARLDAPVTDLSISITKPNGELVQTLQLGPQGSGDITFDWDGKNATGDPAPAGEYVFIAQHNNNGVAGTSPTLLAGNVDSVSLNNQSSSMKLNVAGLGSVDMKDIEQVTD